MKLARTSLLALAFCLAAPTLLLGPACARNPVTRRYEVTLMSTGQEEQSGAEQDKAVRKLYGVYDDKELGEYVGGIGSALVKVAHPRPLEYHFTVIDSAEINAFALPGGYIYVTRGILAQCNSEAELAGVLGHEIGHVTARHHARQQVRAMGLQIGSLLTTVFLGEAGIYLQRYIDLLFVGVYQSFGRQAELQADALGQTYAFEAGWDPEETTLFLKNLDRIENGRDRTVFHGFFASHPETFERIERAEARGRSMVGNREAGRRNRKAYLAMLDGLPYGNRPELGEFDQNLYRNAKAGISIRFPEHWQNFASEGTVVSRRPGESYFLQLVIGEFKDPSDLEGLVSREDYYIRLRELAEKFESKNRWHRESEERLLVNEIPTFAATYEVQSYLGRFYTVRAHFVILGKNLFVLQAFTPINEKDLAEYYFQQVFQSVRRLGPEEIEELKPRKIYIYEVRKGDTFESIARDLLGNTAKAREIAAFNGYISALDPTPGDLLKVVIRTPEADPPPEKAPGPETPPGRKPRTPA